MFGPSGQVCSLAHYWYLEVDHATNDNILHRPFDVLRREVKVRPGAVS